MTFSTTRIATLLAAVALPLIGTSVAAGAGGGKIHFSGVTYGKGGNTNSDVVTGAIDDFGSDKSMGKTHQKIILSKGSFVVDTTKLNKSFKFTASKTGCSGTATGGGKNMPIVSGTGAYAGITGTISVKASFVQIGKVVNGKCNLKKEIAGNGTITGDGTVSY